MVVTELAKAHEEKEKGNKKEREIYEAGFHTIGGFITGFAMVYLWDKFKIPHRDDKITHSLLTHEEIKTKDNTTVGRTIAMALAGGLILAGALGGIKGASPAGGGILLGYEMALSLQKKKDIGKV